MATYEQLEYNPISQALFNNRITTPEGLQRALKDHAFLALDTEHVPIGSQRGHILHQVGLAYIPALSPRDVFPISCHRRRPRLENFYEHNALEGITLNINLNNETRKSLIRCRGSLPSRRPSRFGQDYKVNLNDLESIILAFIRAYQTPSTRLVLVGFEMSAVWTYLVNDFPKVIPYFTSWVDLRDIANDIAITGSAPWRYLPKRNTMLQVFGYPRRNMLGSNQHGAGANAGDNAVSTLAMADALFYPENQERLRFHQCCEQIVCEGRVYNEDNIEFGATIRPETGVLPEIMNSSMK